MSECEVKKVNMPKFPPPQLIVLTVEEAEKLIKLLDLCEYWLTNNNVSYDCDAWASLLEERIEQAKGYISINNASFMEGKLILPEQAESE